MTQHPDLAPPAWATSDLLRGVPDDRLEGPTPCPDYTVGGMIGHVHGLSLAFTAAAAKDFGPLTSSAPVPREVVLPEDWRDTTPLYLDALGQAWRDPAAWDGMTSAGGVDFPAEVAGLVALTEVVVHGWDMARSTGQPYDPGAEAAAAVHAYLVQSRTEDIPAAIFGPAVPVGDDAPLLERIIGLTGRDPAWTP